MLIYSTDIKLCDVSKKNTIKNYTEKVLCPANLPILENLNLPLCLKLLQIADPECKNKLPYNHLFIFLFLFMWIDMKKYHIKRIYL